MHRLLARACTRGDRARTRSVSTRALIFCDCCRVPGSSGWDTMKIYPIVVCAASLVGCLLGGNDSEEGRPTQSDGNGKEASFSHPLCDQYLDCVREAAPQ